jgi:hypothetical protein
MFWFLVSCPFIAQGFGSIFGQRLFEVVDQEGHHLLSGLLRVSGSEERSKRILAFSSSLRSFVLKVAVRAILAVPVTPGPVVADAIRGGRLNSRTGT